MFDEPGASAKLASTQQRQASRRHPDVDRVIACTACVLPLLILGVSVFGTGAEWQLIVIATSLKRESTLAPCDTVGTSAHFGGVAIIGVGILLAAGVLADMILLGDSARIRAMAKLAGIVFGLGVLAAGYGWFFNTGCPIMK